MIDEQTPPYCSCPLIKERDARVAFQRRLRCEAHGPAALAQRDQLEASLADALRTVERTVKWLSVPVGLLFGPAATSPAVGPEELSRWVRYGARRSRRRRG